MDHSRLICTNGSCDGIVAVVPGEWPAQVVRTLGYRENSRPGYGTLWCPKCRCKLEVGPFAAEAA